MNIACNVNPSAVTVSALSLWWITNQNAPSSSIHLKFILSALSIHRYMNSNYNLWLSAIMTASKRSLIQVVQYCFAKTWRMWSMHSVITDPCRFQTTSGTLRWRHNGRDSVSNHQAYNCLLNRLFRRRSKKTSKLRVTGLCVGNSPGTGQFPAQMASNAENVSIWWRHHGKCIKLTTNDIKIVAKIWPGKRKSNHNALTPQCRHLGEISVTCCSHVKTSK